MQEMLKNGQSPAEIPVDVRHLRSAFACKSQGLLLQIPSEAETSLKLVGVDRKYNPFITHFLSYSC